MKILITGANGLLGQKLVVLLAGNTEVEIVATSRGKNRNVYTLPSYTYRSLDITQPEQVTQVIGEEKPDVIIHTAAMTNVDEAEEKQDACWLMNVEAVKYLIHAAEANNSFFVHLSTDFIFSGDRPLLREGDHAKPINFYGKSKLKAEELVRQSNLEYAIARTALVYGITPHMSRSNIILWVKNSLENGKPISVVNDQYRTPTLAEDLATGCFLIAKQKAKGIYHISGKEVLTPYQMAMQVVEFFGLDASLITQTDSRSLQQKAMRPPETGFVIDKAIDELGYKPHSFREGIKVLSNQIEALESQHLN